MTIVTDRDGTRYRRTGKAGRFSGDESADEPPLLIDGEAVRRSDAYLDDGWLQPKYRGEGEVLEPLPRIRGWPAAFGPAQQFLSDAPATPLRQGDWYAVVLPPSSISILRSNGGHRAAAGKPLTLDEVSQGGKAYLLARADPSADVGP